MAKSNNKRKWSAEKGMLARAFLGLTGKTTRILDIERGMEGEIGYTSKNGNIHLAYEHEIMKDLSDIEKVSFRRGVFAHEALHQIFTDFISFERKIMSYKVFERQIFSTINNILEDAAIESFAPQVMGGTMLASLHYTIATIYKKSQPIDTITDPFSQYIASLINFGDMGLVKGRFTFPEVKSIFSKTAPLFEKGIETTSGKERVRISSEIMEISKPLWKQVAEDNEKMQKLLEEMQKRYKSSMQGKGTGRDADEVESGKSKASKRRKITITKVTKEELEEMKKNGEISENSEGSSGGNGDINAVMCDEDKDGSSSSGNSGIPSDENNSSDNNSNKNGDDISADDADIEIKESEEYKKKHGKNTDNGEENSDKNGNNSGSNANGDTDKSVESTDSETPDKSKNSSDEQEGSETKSGENKNGENGKSSDGNNKKSDNKNQNSMPQMDSGKDNPFYTPHGSGNDKIPNMSTPENFEESDEANRIGEIDEEEYQLSEEEVEKISAEVEAAEVEYDKEQEKENSVPEIQNYPITSPKLGKKSCLNYRVTYSDNDVEALETSYNKVVSQLNPGIKTLTTQLRRIFENDYEEKEYRNSGKINTKRMYSGRVTARVFDRRIAPTGKSNFAVEILVDESGSMSCSNKDISARYACIALAEVFNNLGIPLYIIGFTADTKGYDIVHNHYITWKNTHNERLKLLNISARANNCDGYSIRYASEVLKKNKSDNKLLIVLSDGQPAASGYYDGVPDTRHAINDAKKSASVLGVAIGNSDTETIHYMYEKDFLHISHIDDLFSGLSKQIQKLMKTWGN